MRNLYLDSSTYDIVIGNDYNLRFTSTLTEYISQKIENALSTFLGEWFLDVDLGIPFYERILKKRADIDDVNNIFLVAITDIPEVEEVIEFNTTFDQANRTYTVTFKVRAEEVVEGTVEV